LKAIRSLMPITSATVYIATVGLLLIAVLVWHSLKGLSTSELIVAATFIAAAVALPPIASKGLGLITAARLSEERRLKLEMAYQEMERLSARLRKPGESRPAPSNHRGFRRLFESNLAGIIFADLDGNVTGANDAYLEMIGYTREELNRGEIRWSDLTPPEYRPLDEEAIIKVKALGLCAPWEKEYIRKDGSRVKAMIGVALIEGSEDECIAFILDISDRKQIEEALRLSEERYRFLAESGKELTSSLDYDKTLQNVARLAVPTVADYCQIYLRDEQGEIRPVAATHIDPAKEAILLDVQRRYLPNANNDANPIIKVIRSGQPELLTEISGAFLKSIARDEEQLSIFEKLAPRSGMVVPLVAHGNRLGAITFVAAESGRRYGAAELALAEEIARRAAIAVDNARLYREAQEANRIKDEFLATVSHELRTPLNAILGWLHLLKTNRLDEPTEKVAFDTIERNARSQAQLVEDLLDISRIITGKLRVEVQPVRLEPIITSALDGVRPAAEAKAIELRAKFDRDAGEVAGDPDRLRQIFWNLVSNAIKFTPTGGRVDVRVERAAESCDNEKISESESKQARAVKEVSEVKESSEVKEGGRVKESGGAIAYLRITVSDTGEGISPEFLPHVFERFRQADASTTRLHGGLGLGLAIVQHLVELHGGSIEAYSPGIGQGTSITVNLPLASSLCAASKGKAVERKISEGAPASDSPSQSASPSPPSLRTYSAPQYGPLARAEGDVEPLADGHEPCDRLKLLDGLRLLIVDDEPDTLEMLSAALKECGARVKAVESAGDAFKALQAWRPHVLIGDIGMPVEDGYDMIERIRKLDPEQGGSTPAIALTAYARIEDRERALRAGYQEHIPKPVEPDELIEVIASLAGGRGAL
jgi:PAS domain S-box-containing protein